VTSYGLDGSGFKPRQWQAIFLFSKIPPGHSGAHPASYLLLAVKWLGSEANHSPSYSAKVRNEWSYTFTAPCMPSWSGQGQLYFLFYLLQRLLQYSRYS